METANKFQLRGLSITEVETPGKDYGDGLLRDAHGNVVRVPKSRLKKMGQLKATEATTEAPVPEEVPAAKPKRKKKQEPVLQVTTEKVVFATDLGEVSGQYAPVIDLEDFIVLGLTAQSFIPKSYREAPQLRLQAKYQGLESEVVFTGCKFRDPNTKNSYIILMKVGH